MYVVKEHLYINYIKLAKRYSADCLPNELNYRIK